MPNDLLLNGYWASTDIQILPDDFADLCHRYTRNVIMTSTQKLTIVKDTVRTRSLLQDDWRIVYDHYFSGPGELPLPRRIQLERGEISLKLVIERW